MPGGTPSRPRRKDGDSEALLQSGTDATAGGIELKDGRHGTVRVVAGQRQLGELTPASIVAIGIRNGTPVTEELVSLIEGRAAFEKAYKVAAGVLSRGPVSARAMRERLAKRGFESRAVEEVMTALAKSELINDAEMARQLVREETARGGAGAARLEARLAARGVDAETTARVLEETRGDEATAALRAARKRAASLPAGLPAEARARRLYAYLSRRGFDERDSMEAVRAVTGISGDAEG